ncbi:protein D2-like [Octopus sinensis]|uniref:Protein D2-like n=1 Tax=Octopus sinensis TaxID=2607531 RepID=A0A7E6FKJ6_9MOLL|nr:protein D2-like [Octopus sinensis]
MEAFNTHGLVNRIVDRLPSKQLLVRYNNVEIEPGMTITPSQSRNPPQILFDSHPREYYTLIMNDPDSPSRNDPKFSEFNHWLVVNIREGDVSKGETMSEYVGPLPAKGSGHHRYVFMLYKQPNGRMDFPGLKKLTNNSAEGRPNHRMRDFARKYYLQDAIYGNFFQAEWDESVPKLQQQIKMQT